MVDPGVGTERKSVVVRSKTGHYFVGPDNGLYTLVAEKMGLAAVRDIDESRQRLKGSEASHTFHGRDIFAYVGARLASGKLKFDDVGPDRAELVIPGLAIFESIFSLWTPPRLRVADRGLREGMLLALMEGADDKGPRKRKRKRRGGRRHRRRFKPAASTT